MEMNGVEYVAFFVHDSELFDMLHRKTCQLNEESWHEDHGQGEPRYVLCDGCESSYRPEQDHITVHGVDEVDDGIVALRAGVERLEFIGQILVEDTIDEIYGIFNEIRHATTDDKAYVIVAFAPDRFGVHLNTRPADTPEQNEKKESEIIEGYA